MNLKPQWRIAAMVLAGVCVGFGARDQMAFHEKRELTQQYIDDVKKVELKLEQDYYAEKMAAREVQKQEDQKACLAEMQDAVDLTAKIRDRMWTQSIGAVLEGKPIPFGSETITIGKH